MPEGDAKKNCAIEKCQYNRRFGSLCSKHADATQKKYCDVKGCTNQFHARGKCVRHGGGCFCKSTGCHRHARIGGFCTRHAELSANIPLGAPLAKPDMLDWAILQDLLEDARNTDNSVEHVDKHAKHSKKIAV
ncbi:hypothetical protein AC1031_004340 [Aphanomyces cochlioides]|nr:hypothetical protein AC1031_004340 [Aphanomyces cochlioides]